MTPTIKTLAALKRHCQPGVTLTMIRHDRMPNGKLLNKPRKIIKTQSNAIVFESEISENGSWLNWPKANAFVFLPDGFAIKLNPDLDDSPTMEYSYQ